MKIVAIMTAEEKNKTLKSIMFDPCTHIQCDEMDCDQCPLQSVREAFQDAQENYARAINKIIIEGE